MEKPNRSRGQHIKKQRFKRDKKGGIILGGSNINWDAGFELIFGFSYPIKVPDQKAYFGEVYKINDVGSGGKKPPMPH